MSKKTEFYCDACGASTGPEEKRVFSASLLVRGTVPVPSDSMDDSSVLLVMKEKSYDLCKSCYVVIEDKFVVFDLVKTLVGKE